MLWLPIHFTSIIGRVRTWLPDVPPGAARIQKSDI
jgi:hypothetical protein